MHAHTQVEIVVGEAEAVATIKQRIADLAAKQCIADLATKLDATHEAAAVVKSDKAGQEADGKKSEDSWAQKDSRAREGKKRRSGSCLMPWWRSKAQDVTGTEPVAVDELAIATAAMPTPATPTAAAAVPTAAAAMPTPAMPTTAAAMPTAAAVVPKEAVAMPTAAAAMPTEAVAMPMATAVGPSAAADDEVYCVLSELHLSEYANN